MSLFITLEGIDCSGKTTVTRQIAQHLTNNNIEHVVTREPGGTIIAEQLRSMLLDINNKIDRDTELMMFMTARCNHINNLIKPALADNKVVICDRYIDSSLVYQSKNIAHMHTINMLFEQYEWSLIPHYTLYLKVSKEVTLQRMSGRNQSTDRMEEQLLSHLDSSIEKFNVLSEMKHFLVIDANQDIDSVTQQALMTIESIIALDREIKEINSEQSKL